VTIDWWPPANSKIRKMPRLQDALDAWKSVPFPVAFSLFNTAHGPGGTRVPSLLDRPAGRKTDPIERTVIDRALCAVDLAR
jgi:hypothetical protein